jgi:hypothetical protein
VQLAASPLFDRGRAPRAGRRFAARLAVVDPASRRWATSGHVSCQAKVGRRSLPVVRAGFRGRLARCVFRIPRVAAGRTMAGMVTVQGAGGATARRWFSRTVR